MKWKKTILFFLCFILLFSAFPLYASANEKENSKYSSYVWFEMHSEDAYYGDANTYNNNNLYLGLAPIGNDGVPLLSKALKLKRENVRITGDHASSVNYGETTFYGNNEPDTHGIYIYTKRTGKIIVKYTLPDGTTTSINVNVLPDEYYFKDRFTKNKIISSYTQNPTLYMTTGQSVSGYIIFNNYAPRVDRSTISISPSGYVSTAVTDYSVGTNIVTLTAVKQTDTPVTVIYDGIDNNKKYTWSFQVVVTDPSPVIPLWNERISIERLKTLNKNIDNYFSEDSIEPTSSFDVINKIDWSIFSSQK